MSDVTTTYLILGVVVAAFVWDKLPVAIGVALSLWATGVLTLEQALAGFGDPPRSSSPRSSSSPRRSTRRASPAGSGSSSR
jgi:hypothetical protein